ncbi:MAG TPA: hypothetical protein VII82_11280 [Polyangiaceae bacterium]
MREKVVPSSRRCTAPFGILLVLGPAGAACFPDSAAFGYYAATDDAGPDAPVASDAGGPTAESSAPASTEDDANMAAGAIDAAPAGPCDLTGRWLLSTREVATAIGAVEAAHTWRYFELSQVGSDVTVSKGLDCGANVRGVSSVAANVDYPKTWPAMQANAGDTGRNGTSTETSSGCQVSFEKRYQVLGATTSYFDDPSRALPPVSQQAASGSPGWEDWDQDGNPGFTMNVTGLVTGQLYIVTREWSAWSGAIAARATTFTLADDWDSEQDVLGYDGPSLLTEATAGVKDGDASQHFTYPSRRAERTTSTTIAPV